MAADKPPETRPSSTRSRNGCLQCRSRRVRCDEKRPSCNNCVIKKLACSYVPILPLRERRAATRPGEQTPWVVQKSTSLPPARIFARPGYDFLDPFDALPIKMPLKSKELLHYFLQAGATIGPLPVNPNDCVASATRNPEVLQNTMLVSALHYAWNKGDLAAFEPTFLFHKIESIKQVNTWLTTSSRAKEILRCAKYISTLCFVECCLGNFAVAESHLNGLAIYLSTKDRETLRQECDCDVDLELTDRYLVVASNMIHSTKSRLAEVVPPEVISQPLDTDLEVPELSRMIHKMHLSEANGPELRLRAFRMVPFFFGSIPPGREPKDLDMFPAISILRPITELAMPTNSKDRGDPDIPMPWNVWNSGAPSKLLYTVITAHIQSFSNKIPLPTHGEPVYVSGWSGFCSAVDFYLTTVLAVCNQGLPPQRVLHYLKVDIVKRDLQNGPPLFDSMNTETRNLWFWKAFMCALSAMEQQIPETEINLVHQFKHQDVSERFKFELWQKRDSIAALIRHHLQLHAGDTCIVLPHEKWIHGCFNVCVQAQVTAGNSTKKFIFRCPIPPHAGQQYPGIIDEKVGCEVATYIWMQQHCPEIRIPDLFAFGFTDDSSFIHIQQTSIFTGLWRKAWKCIYQCLRYPVLSDYVRDKAAPAVGTAYMLLEYIGPETGEMLSLTWFDHWSDTARRKNLFAGMSRIMLSLARVPQQKIGSFRFNTLDCTIALSNRPLMCSLAIFEQQGTPRTIRQDQVYQNTDSFVSDMLTLHDNHLIHNPHAVRDEEDAEERITLRTLLRVLAHFFVLPERRSGPYLLQLTDFHQSNIFVDKEWNVTCMIDLEWICALPVEMMRVPFWLTNRRFERIVDHYEDFDDARKEFLSSMDQELEHVEVEHDIQITRTMRQSWDSKGVWYWACIESTNGWLFVLEDHIIPMFSSVKGLVDDLKQMYFFWQKDARKHIETKAADERRYQLKLRSLFQSSQQLPKE
ncbi:unnamed protein product [Fusarium graminearum]|uniref:Zn(2)-C6 fungal-type domain-containing protein n=1 Tax=Gibberella zeae TaxID=5518 RepID=A0A9N8RLE9_GIBZA|nr:unnamed protein product [Fusarium graminearum]